MNTEPLAHGWDWSAIDAMKGTVVDVGGARGAVACGLAKHYPNIKFIVQDFADVVAEGPENVPESMKSQVEFMAASCLEEQPVKGKEVYFMRAILHNWPDDYCVKILKNILPGECVFSPLYERGKD
jgi:O-methyltransferase domain